MTEAPELQRLREAREAHSAGLIVRQADLARAQPPRWAWQARIVLGYLNLLVGNEGVGKGATFSWLAARLTHGELPGDYRGKPIGVGIIGDEDSFDQVWTPRLHAAGADLSRVVQIEHPDSGFVNLKEDRDKLAAVVRDEGLGFLYLDALLDNLGVGVDDWRNKQVRDALQPARALARELDIAVLGCLHPNKHAESFRQLVSGASAFNAVSRSSLLLAEHPEDESRRVLVRGKGNLSATPEAIEFTLAGHVFSANGHVFDVPIARDFTPGTLVLADLIGDERAVREHSKTRDAVEIIEALLPKGGDWHPAKPIFEACAGEEIDERTANRAKQRLRLEHRRASTFHAPVEWRWPITPDTDQTYLNGVRSVGSVRSGESPNSGTLDTQDTPDVESTRRECVRTGENGHSGRTDAELEQRIHDIAALPTEAEQDAALAALEAEVAAA
jgi:AAA domain